jgi:hypothetical protein
MSRVRCSLLVSLAILLCRSSAAQTGESADPVVSLDSEEASLCSETFAGLEFSRVHVVVYGRHSDLVQMFSNGALTHVHSCSALLTADPTATLTSKLNAVPLASPRTRLRQGHIEVHFVRAQDFASARQRFVAAGGGRGNGGSTPPPPPSDGPDGGKSGKPDRLDAGCDLGSEMCVSSDGTATFSVACENGLGISFSTDGSIGVVVKADGKELTVPISK